jgi:hypothetical protein
MPRKKPKTFLQEHPIVFYILIVATIILALNIVILFPPGLAGIFYDIEHFIIRFFLLPMPLHRIELFIIILLAAIAGYFAVPMLWIPSADEIFFYRKSWSDGKLRYFKTWLGNIVAVNEDWLVKKGLKYVLIGDIESISENEEGIMVYEGKDMEVTQALLDQSYKEALEERISKLEETIKRGQQIPPELIDLIKTIVTRQEEKK